MAVVRVRLIIHVIYIALYTWEPPGWSFIVNKNLPVIVLELVSTLKITLVELVLTQ